MLGIEYEGDANGGAMNFDNRHIDEAAEVLRAGGLVAFPTETVYGLGADARNRKAIRKIFAAKGRPADHPVIVHLPSADALVGWAREVPETAHHLAEAFWPGPLTLILKRSEGVPDAVTGGQDTVGLRVPGHPLALALLEAFGGGVAAPSANCFGRVSPTRAEHVRTELGEAVDLILDGGPCEVGLESTILDLSTDAPRLLRPGGVGVAALEAVLSVNLNFGGGNVRAPGTLASHYAPTTPTFIVPAEELTVYLERHKGKNLGVLARRAQQNQSKSLFWKTLPNTPKGFGRGLYATLRELDSSGVERIIVEAPPEGDAWLAVRDRLARAAKELHD